MTENFHAAGRQFVTDNSDVQSVLEAAVENNRFNDGQITMKRVIASSSKLFGRTTTDEPLMMLYIQCDDRSL